MLNTLKKTDAINAFTNINTDKIKFSLRKFIELIKNEYKSNEDVSKGIIYFENQPQIIEDEEKTLNLMFQNSLKFMFSLESNIVFSSNSAI